eukprot:TRINITY_DN479_c0_g2_i2.p1 TRINITY_DN479_c0_g2~~TRINITY_DN479_c0_g2_i2.p1  ORF type:complete len:150 (+),score=10.74 TRINITY_DN479_c0_g2_i2:94-543(+)
MKLLFSKEVMSANGIGSAVTRVEDVRKRLLKDTYARAKANKLKRASDVRIVVNSYERAGGFRARRSYNYSRTLCTAKINRRLNFGPSQEKPREVKRIVDARLSDAGFGGRILERLFVHSKESAKDSNKGQMLSAIKSLRIMGLELRNTI